MSDPFDELDDVHENENREGDPFEAFEVDSDPESSDGAAGRSGGTDPETTADVDADADPFEHLDGAGPGVPPNRGDEASSSGQANRSREGNSSGAANSSGSERPDTDVADGNQVDVAGDPFGDVDVSRGDPFESAESPFQHVDVEGVDADDVWERFTDDLSTGGEASADVTADADADVEPPEDDVVVVSKHEFCEGCPNFTPPPDAHCTHEGTTIREFVGPDNVRVSNCPVVDERRELGEVHE